MLGGRRDIHPIGGTGDGLAIRAMANSHGFGVDLRLETELPAMPLAFDFHIGLLVRFSRHPITLDSKLAGQIDKVVGYHIPFVNWV